MKILKRTLSFLLTLCMITGVQMPVPVKAAETVLDAWVTTATMTEQDGELTVEALVTNNTGTETAVRVIATVYDSSGKTLVSSTKIADIADFCAFTFVLDVRATRSQLKRLRTKSLYKGIA